MKKIYFIGCIILFFILNVEAQDPAITDGDKYKVIFENERVRVLDYKDRPGEKTSRHHYPDFVLYALTEFNRRLTMGEGKQVIKELKEGDVIWMKEQIHIGENIGNTDTHALIVELKEPLKTQARDSTKTD